MRADRHRGVRLGHGPRAGYQPLRHPPKGVIVKLGGDGALVMDQQTEILVEGIPVKGVDATAAGDAFCGAFAVALAGGMSITEAAHFANVVGALTVTDLGAQPSPPTLAEMRRFAADR